MPKAKTRKGAEEAPRPSAKAPGDTEGAQRAASGHVAAPVDHPTPRSEAPLVEVLAGLRHTDGLGPPAPSVFITLAHGDIVPDADNARQAFDEAALDLLADTILTHGLLQPLVARPTGAGEPWALVAGERRWRAIGRLIAAGRLPPDWPIPVREARDLAEADVSEAALIENLQRVDLNHMETAEAFDRLGERWGRSNRQIADALGRDIAYVQQHRRLMKLPEADRERVRDGAMRLHDALELAARPTPEPLAPRIAMTLAEIAGAQDAGWAATCSVARADVIAGLSGVVFRPSNWAHECSISVYRSEAFDPAPFAGRTPEGLVELNRLRLAAGFTWTAEGDTVPEARPGDAYVNHWLREPFDFGEANRQAKAAAEVAEADRARARAADVEREKQVRKAVAKRLRGYATLSAEKLTEQAAKLIRFPLFMDDQGDVFDQAGAVWAWTNYGDAPDGAALICLLLNRAAGMPGYGPEPKGDDEADEAEETEDDAGAIDPAAGGGAGAEGAADAADSVPADRPSDVAGETDPSPDGKRKGRSGSAGLVGDAFSRQMAEARAADDAIFDAADAGAAVVA